MHYDFDLLALPVARRLQIRAQLVRHRQACLRAWRACFRQVQRDAAGHVPLTVEAVDHAHEAHVVLGVVGQPVWTN
jgi:hypothetical protein